MFGYGSLAEIAGARPATLEGHSRVWDIAMDNTVDIPGYKYWVDSATGVRPEIKVAYLDLVQQPGAWVNGCLFAVTAEQLAQFDRRERNYRRAEVVVQADEGPEPAFVYLGLDEARQRFEQGLRDDRLAVAADYYERVREGFDRLGDYELASFDSTTAPLPCPLLELRCLNLSE